MKFRSICYIAVAILLMAWASCKKDLTNANIDPTKSTPQAYNPNFLLTEVQLMYTGSTDFGAENWYDEWGEIAEFVQHTASTNTAFYSGDKYLNNVGGFGVYFDHSYIYQVQPVVELYQLTLNKPQYRNLHQIARLMKALVFERITDLYGDIPYSQAGLGYYSHIFTPAYDKQQDIYTDLIKEVRQATDSLNDNYDKPTGDVFYSADPGTQIERWKRFGNTLLLRMGMRLTKVDPTTAQGIVTSVLGKTMQSNDDNAIVQHQPGNNVTQNRDAWAIFGQDSTDVKLCSTYINFLKDNNDPRLPVIAWIYWQDADGNVQTDDDPNDQVGMPPGYIVGGTNPAIDITQTPTYPQSLGIYGYSRFNDGVLNNSAPNLVLTYAESEFLLADANKRWGIGTSAAEHYDNGVTAAFTQLQAYGAGISEADAADYLTSHPYKDSDGLNMINTQFWASTIFNEYEAWSNWRRTSSAANPNGYPALTPTHYPGNITNGTIPRRLAYPPSEKVSNPANYNAAVARLQGGDHITSRVWWDTQ
ncbi:MAG: SusD/RagB family nutrient-binding outer membrane lipoprotein [Bacteroidetes bacterium]|nr:SusD/RagB family nutrient-binding outer membrane lipoprotein [Bacteroidota bacterium]